jgi:hypothetical protein
MNNPNQPLFTAGDDYLSTAAAAKLLKISPQKLWALAESGAIEAPVRLSERTRLWKKSELLNFDGVADATPNVATISLTEAAQILGVCYETARRLAAKGELGPIVKVNKRIRLQESHVIVAAEWRENRELVGLDYLLECLYGDQNLLEFILKDQRLHPLPPIRGEARDGGNLYWAIDLVWFANELWIDHVRMARYRHLLEMRNNAYARYIRNTRNRASELR